MMFEIFKIGLAILGGLSIKFIYDVVIKTYRNGNGNRRTADAIVLEKLNAMGTEIHTMALDLTEVKTTVKMQQGQIGEIFKRIRSLEMGGVR